MGSEFEPHIKMATHNSLFPLSVGQEISMDFGAGTVVRIYPGLFEDAKLADICMSRGGKYTCDLCTVRSKGLCEYPIVDRDLNTPIEIKDHFLCVKAVSEEDRRKLSRLSTQMDSLPERRFSKERPKVAELGVWDLFNIDRDLVAYMQLTPDEADKRTIVLNFCLIPGKEQMTAFAVSRVARHLILESYCDKVRVMVDRERSDISSFLEKGGFGQLETDSEYRILETTS